MSEQPHPIRETAPEGDLRLYRIGPAGMIVGIVCLAFCLISIFVQPDNKGAMLEGYVFSFSFWVSMTLGCFGMSLLHHTLRGKWSLSTLRIWEAGGSGRMFGWMAVLLLPIFLSLPAIYEWAVRANVDKDKVLQWKQPYLNPTSFAVQAIAFFLVWFALSRGMRKSVQRQEQDGNFREEQKRASYGAAGLVFFVLSVTFAFTHWVMSINPHWFSTMLGLIFVVGQGLMGLALGTLIVCTNADREPYRTIVTPALTRDLGNMMLTFTMLWGYVNLSQYLIIWHGNLPETTQFYVNQSQFGWNVVGCILIFGQFFIPFMALLSPKIKRYPQLLARVAGWILVMRLVDTYYTVIPMFRTRHTPMPHWQDGLAFLAIGGLWLAAFAAGTRRSPLIPTHDPRILETEHAH